VGVADPAGAAAPASASRSQSARSVEPVCAALEADGADGAPGTVLDAAPEGAAHDDGSAAVGKALPPAGKLWPVGMALARSWNSKSNGATVGDPPGSRWPGGRAAAGGPRPSGTVAASKSGGGAAATSIHPTGKKTCMPQI
jgi:hypothetical protein